MKITDQAFHRLGRMILEDLAPAGLVLENRYEVGELIARGGMGEVFRARDLTLGRPVAIKMIGAPHAQDAGIRRFKAEARTMGQIDHPGIVPVHDLGTLPDGRLFYVMKLVEGVTLEEKIRAGAEARELVGWLADASAIVERAHDRGVIHRDLKPSNIMVDAHGQVYVLDWGVARVREGMPLPGGEGGVAGAGLTSAGTVVGTLGYLSPEQARGDLGGVDERTDVYGLGAILYEILTGREPAYGVNVTEALAAVVEGTVPAPRELDPSVPSDLESICRKALSPLKEDRYPSPIGFAEDLKRWLKEEPVEAFVGGAPYSVGLFVRRHRILVGAMTVSALCLLGWGGIWISEREDRALAASKRMEDEIFGPLQFRLESLGEDPDGWQRGIRLLREGLSRYDASWSAWVRLGELHEKRSEYREAVDAFSRALEINPQLGAVHYQRGRIRMDALHDPDHAEGDFLAALRVEPENEYAALGRARLAMIRGDFPEALRLTREIQAVARHVDDLHFVRGHVFHSPEAGPLYDPERAIQEFSLVIERRPRKSVAYASRGYVYKELGRDDEALSDFTTALELDPRDDLSLQYRGVVYRRLGKLEDAAQDLDRAIELRPDRQGPYVDRSNIRRDLKDAEGAMEDAERAIGLDPSDAAGYLCRGNLLSDQARRAEAVDDYTRAIELDPHDPAVFVARARVQARGSHLKEALADLDQALRLDPDHWYGLVNRGRVLRNLGRRKQAIRDYTRAIDVAPHRASAYNGRGICLSQENELDRAFADFSKAVELDPTSSSAIVNRGVVHSKRREYALAAADYERGAVLDPGNRLAHYNLGRTYLAMNEHAKALAPLTRAIELGPRIPHPYLDRGICRKATGDLAGAKEDLKKAMGLASPSWHYRKMAATILKQVELESRKEEE